MQQAPPYLGQPQLGGSPGPPPPVPCGDTILTELAARLHPTPTPPQPREIQGSPSSVTLHSAQVVIQHFWHAFPCQVMLLWLGQGQVAAGKESRKGQSHAEGMARVVKAKG